MWFQWLWNLFGIGFGLVFGCMLGLSVGPYVFPELLKPKEFSFLDESADADDDIQVRPSRPYFSTRDGCVNA